MHLNHKMTKTWEIYCDNVLLGETKFWIGSFLSRFWQSETNSKKVKCRHWKRGKKSMKPPFHGKEIKIWELDYVWRPFLRRISLERAISVNCESQTAVEAKRKCFLFYLKTRKRRIVKPVLWELSKCFHTKQGMKRHRKIVSK